MMIFIRLIYCYRKENWEVTLDYDTDLAIIKHHFKGLYVVRFFLFSLLFGSITYANDDVIAKLCKEMKIVPASKAIVQWERVFSSQKHKVRYRIDGLTPDMQVQLKEYLIQHAADSSQPMVPGL